MGIDRKTFLKVSGALVVGSMLTPSHMLLASALKESGGSKESAKRWGMVVDLTKCDGCKLCENICREENNVPSYNDPRYDAYWLRVLDVKQTIPNTEEQQIPLMCQHCADPPCVHVCVTKASFVREDGIVLIDEHRCIGCRYCVIACPYRARSIIFRNSDKITNDQVPKMMIGVATKCTLCVHRIDKGGIPACVEGCPMKALTFGDLHDPESEVGKLVAEGIQVLRPEKMLDPGVLYKGL